ncbi:ABC transporter ATP-binding protein [Shewanella sp. UCD-KL12]|uniref:ABC transporter ATP-binding protein n=1 Tax=Shewanella sp. UCD-KL12 TaxID=1917163 RepID=UPI0009702740|nr:ABC transporter ATP-binding protein [Shewanella sp. UCD-KL12]
MSTLSIQSVHSDYQGQQVLKGLDLNLEKGEIVALLGPSGCGKTTLLRAVAGLQSISQGQICINGEVLSSTDKFVPSERRGVGMIFQDYALFPHLTVADNVLFGLKEGSKAQKATRLKEMLELVKLDDLQERYPHELSGGQQQRVSIARALAYEPEILLLDEPFSNIDAKVRGEMMLEIRSILKERNVSAVFVTHSKDEAFVFADKLALFKDGYIVQFGTAEELYTSPKDRYVADFLGSGNYIPVSVTDSFNVDTPIGTLTSTSELAHPIRYQGEILLRPQQIEITADDEGLGVITERRFLGNICHYQVQVAQQFYDVKSQLSQFMPGQKVHLQAQAHSLVVF